MESKLNTSGDPGPVARIDALASSGSRAKLFRYTPLISAPDPVLQSLTVRAAETANAPIALVSLVLDRIQHFAAFHGLPPDLATACATDREVSLCQFVVRDACELEVRNARGRRDLPQALVEAYDVVAYFGVPLRLGGEVAGALCVIDSKERTFAEEEKVELRELATQASARLEALSKPPAVSDLALRPAFMELRNALTPLLGDCAVAKLNLAELAPRVRVGGGESQVLGVLQNSGQALDSLRDLLDDLDRSAQRVADIIITMETALTRAAALPLGSILSLAGKLAHHGTKLIGGVRWPSIDPGLTVTREPNAAITHVSAFLNIAAEALQGVGWTDGIAPTVTVQGTMARLEMTLSEVDTQAVAESFDRLVVEAPHGVEVEANRIRLYVRIH